MRILPVAALLFIAMGFMATKHSRATFQSHFVKSLDRELQLSISGLTGKLNAFKSSVQAIANNSLIVNSLVDTETRSAYLPIFFNKLQIVGSRNGDIIFTDYKGRLLAANKPGLQVKDLAKYSSVFQGGEYLHIGVTGLDFAVPVIYNGNTEGMIIVRYNHAQLANLLSNGATLHAAIIYKGVDILHSSDKELTQLFKSGINKSNWIERRAQVPQYSNIGIVIAAPEESVLAGLYEIEGFIYFIIFASLTILSLGIFLTIFLTSRELQQFMNQVRSFGHASDLDRKIQPSGFAEIHALTTSFNSMLQRLQNAVVSQTDLKAEVANRKKVEIKLREREERTNAIVENILEGVITIDGQGVIEMCNPAASQIFGYTQDQIVGKNFRTLTPSRDTAKDSGYIRNYVATGQKKALGLCRQVIGLRSDGESFFMELTMSPMVVGDRNMFTCVVRDITEQRRVENLKNEFVSIVSHELRTPLTALVGSLALVSTGVVGTIPDKAKNLISIAHNNAKRLTQLVNDILDIEKIESGKMEYNFDELDMVEVANLVLKENQPYGDKYDVSLRLECDVDQAFIRADQNRLIQVFNNLLSNAIKFSPAGDEVVLKLEPQDDLIRCTVIDNGDGIPEEMKQKIFEKFTQIDSSDSRSNEGTGLGLGIASSIVASHDSILKVKSELGYGSTFYFDMRMVEGRSNEAAHASISAHEIDQPKEKDVA